VLTVTASAEDPLRIATDLLVVPVFKGGIDGPGAGAVLAALGLDAWPVTPQFRGDIGQQLLLSTPGLPARGVLLVGLGRMDATNNERLRRAAGVAARAARHAPRVATTLSQVHAGPAAVEAVAEGFALGAYSDRRHLGQHAQPPPSSLRDVVVLTPSSQLAEARQALVRAERYASATISARDLVNLPPGEKRPADLAEAIGALVAGSCEVESLDAAALRAEGFGGLLAVGRGSSAEPRLLRLRYRPATPLGHVALVGKGITFDSGGLNLKRGTGMEWMKADMAGAAAIAGACSVLGDLGVRLEVTALLALAENMPGRDAQRPDDVIRIHGGTTVEVRDTDAEGRLVLADALHAAAQLAPDAIVDLATLTGSSLHAVGRLAAAAMGNDAELLASLLRAAGVVGESLWELPLWDDLDHLLDSPVADLNNTGDGANGGAIMGGLFLRRFVADVPWAHLDIAGPSFRPIELAGGYSPPGGTGYGVRTLLAWLERRGD
jgi:leucyl aminopeptidase